MLRNNLVLSALVLSCMVIGIPAFAFGRGGPGVRVGVSVGGPAVRGGVVIGGGGRGYYGRPYGGPCYRPYPRYGWGAPYAFGVGVGMGAAECNFLAEDALVQARDQHIEVYPPF